MKKTLSLVIFAAVALFTVTPPAQAIQNCNVCVCTSQCNLVCILNGTTRTTCGKIGMCVSAPFCQNLSPGAEAKSAQLESIFAPVGAEAPAADLAPALDFVTP